MRRSFFANLQMLKIILSSFLSFWIFVFWKKSLKGKGWFSVNEHAIKHFRPYMVHVNLSWFKIFQLANNKYSSVRLDAVPKAENVKILPPKTLLNLGEVRRKRLSLQPGICNLSLNTWYTNWGRKKILQSFMKKPKGKYVIHQWHGGYLSYSNSVYIQISLLKNVNLVE